VYKSVTTLRNNNKAVKRKTYVQGHRVLQWPFGEKKVKYVSERTLTLCSKNSAF